MRPPRVTVLMSVYNGERYLREALESILGQTFTDFIFLIINDGSTDSSIQIIQSYNDPRICLVHNDGNLGLTASLNKGFMLAQGEYVARMDADDISRPERLARQVVFMDANPLVGVCGSWVQFIPKSNNNVWKLPEKSEMIRCWQFHSVGVAHPSVIMRRQLFVENGLLYDPQFRHIEDYELWGRAIRYMAFANIQKVLLEYRINPVQTCAIHGAEQLETVAPLRRNLVRELGIEPTHDEQLLHEMIMNDSMPPDRLLLDSAEQWLLKLESANRSVGAYQTEYFSRRLIEIWFSISSGFIDESVCTWKRCLRSPLWLTANAPVWHRLRAFGAWAVRKGALKTICGVWHA